MFNFFRKLPTYPASHEPALRVPRGGSMCANCRFLTADKTCASPDYQKYYGTNVLGAPPNQFCSDWWEPRR